MHGHFVHREQFSRQNTGRTLGDTKARTRTSVSIVAIVRDGDVIPSPRPDNGLEAGDSIVAVGTRAGLDKLANIIADSSG